MRLNGGDKAGAVVVAGGAGFLGSHLCERLLQRGLRVICLDSMLTGSRANVERFRDSPRYRFVEHDICEAIDIGERVAGVFNLACTASPPRYQADPVHTMMTSVVGTLNLLAFAERQQARFVQASTSEVYGDPEVHPQREDYRGAVNCTGPRACYDEGKRAAEALCFDLLRAGRLDVRVARIFNTYGPRMQPDDGRIVSNFVAQALSGRPLTVFGDGSQTRSFCYVSDLIEGLCRLMDVSPTPEGPVNLGNPGELAVIELARLVKRLVPQAGPIIHQPLPVDDPRRRCPDISRARSLLAWAPAVPLAEGLEHTVAWFRTDARGLAAVEQPAAAAG